MTPDERKAWEELVEFTRMEDHPVEFFPPHYHGEDGWEPRYDAAILAADQELKRCHEIMEREGKELIHLRIVVQRMLDDEVKRRRMKEG